MKVGEYFLVNADKVDRAINGSVLDKGEVKGGVGANAKPSEILAEYDRLGGLIQKGEARYKVKTGSFYDFKKKQPLKKPEVVLVFHVNGEVIEVAGDEPLPLEIQAAQMADKKKKARAAAKGKGKGKGKKAKKEEEEEEEDSDDEDESDDEDDKEDADKEEGELA